MEKYVIKLWILLPFIPIGVTISYLAWLIDNKLLIIAGFVISIMGLVIPVYKINKLENESWNKLFNRLSINSDLKTLKRL